MNSNKYLEEIATEFENQIDQVINLVDGVDRQTMNVAESEGKWSMLQCIEHMTLATQVYVQNVEEKLTDESNPASSGLFKGSWKGRLFAKMNAPKQDGSIRNKLKTFKTMEPAETLNREETIDRFVSTHQKFIELVKASEKVNLDKTRVATALPMIKLRLGDAYKFILAHTKRHVAQLSRIKRSVVTMGAN